MSKRVLILFGIGFVLIIAGILLLKYELSPAVVESDLEAESVDFDSDLHKDPAQSDNIDSINDRRAKNKVKKVADDPEVLEVTTEGFKTV